MSSNKKGTCECRGDKYAKASLGIQITCLIIALLVLVFPMIMIFFFAAQWNAFWSSIFGMMP